MQINSTLLLFFACLPSAITGFCFWLIQQKISREAQRRDREEENRKEIEKQREEMREQQELFLVKGVNAAITLGEATARAVQRIPDAHCNGDMHEALDYAMKVRREHREFLEKQGISQLHDHN